MKYGIDDLRYLMQRLRDPQTGCPWDIEQQYHTITPYTLEEVYEVVDTIENADFEHLSEELGDLLFQIIFYAQLGEEQRHFSWDDIVHGITAKLVSRHPHVFSDGTLYGGTENSAETADERQIKQNWEQLKQQEREQKGQSGILADVPMALPAMMRSQKLQKRAASIGFDWPDVQGALEKLQEEIAELQQAIAQEDNDAIEEEAGDVLFSVVNAVRKLDLSSETTLRHANQKFIRRMEYMEQQSDAPLDRLSLTELEELWQAAKFS